jgi:subfamily B ATP-binding cassette protein MsbA
VAALSPVLEKVWQSTLSCGHNSATMIKLWRRLWVFVRPYKVRMFLGLLCGILAGVTTAVLVADINIVVDLVFLGKVDLSKLASRGPAITRHFMSALDSAMHDVSAPSSRSLRVLIILTVPTIILIRGFLSYLSIYLMQWASARVVANLRTTVFNHLLNLPLSFFSKARTGDLLSCVTHDTHVLNTIVGTSLASVVKDPVTVLTTLGMLFVFSPKLTLISLLVLPLCLVPITIYGRKVRKSAKAMQGHHGDLTSLMHETFTGNRVIKAYNMEPTILQQFRDTTKRYVSHMMRLTRANEIPGQLSEFFGGVGVALVLLYAEVYMTSGDQRPEPGKFIAFVVGIVMMYPPIKGLIRLHTQLQQAEIAGDHVFSILDTKSTIVDPPNPVPLKASGADIHFENISFHYGDKPLLHNVNLTVKAGQLVALVGASGSGKTTITNLLLRFYDPQSGSVRIGDTDIRQVTLKDLRRQIALVTQETILFHDTIRSNIAVGRADATDAEIEAAARHAHAHEFITQKPEGYATIVGEKGIAISGGQRQRISIARAIVKDAPILVLDEATNSLDAESERAVQADLEELMRHRTTICIAHRLSTIQNADLIVVLDDGQIVETGTHAELMERRGVYHKLYELSYRAEARGRNSPLVPVAS